MKDDLPNQRKRAISWLGGGLVLLLAAPALFIVGGMMGLAESGKTSPTGWLTLPLWAMSICALVGCVYCLVRVGKALK